MCTSNSYDISNVIRLTWIKNKVESFRTQNCLEFNEDADNAIIINRRHLVSGIVHTIIGNNVCLKLHIQPDVASNFAEG